MTGSTPSPTRRESASRPPWRRCGPEPAQATARSRALPAGRDRRAEHRPRASAPLAPFGGRVEDLSHRALAVRLLRLRALGLAGLGEQFEADLLPFARCDLEQELLLLGLAQGRDGVGELGAAGLAVRARFGGDFQQGLVELEEVGQRALRAAERFQARRHRRLQAVLVVGGERVLLDLPAPVGGEPGQVQRAEVAPRDLLTHPRDLGEVEPEAALVLVPYVLLVVRRFL